MSWKKTPSILVFAAIPFLAGFLMVAQAGAEQDTLNSPMTPGIILPGEKDSGSLSIIPADDSITKFELRRILFGWGEGKDKDKSAADKDASDKPQWDKDKGTPTSPSSPKHDKDTGVFGEGHSQSSPKSMDRDSMDRDSGADPTFRYIIWPFSSDSDKSVDSEKQDSLSDRDSGMRDRDYGIDRDRSSSDMGPSSTDTEKDSGLKYIVEESDRDEAEKADEEASKDNVNEAIIILAGMGSSDTMNPRGDMGTTGSTSNGMRSDSTTGSPGSSGMQDFGTGDTSKEDSSKEGAGRNMDRDLPGGMSDRGTSTMDRGTSTMDRDTSGNMGTESRSIR